MLHILSQQRMTMKRQGHLIVKIAAIENLQLAYYKAKKGKSFKNEVYLYGKYLQKNVQLLQQQLLTGNLVIGNYRYFTIYDPKKRLICAAPFVQRVLHHALMNVCHPFFESAQIFHSFASRKGKGTYEALEKAKYNVRRYQWFLKLDFRKYFDSLDHSILNNQLGKLFKDSQLLKILGKIIDSYHITPNKGVPIGNLTSQYFANHYLSPADHYVKEILKIPAYIRYMDDLVLWHNDKERLKTAGIALKNFTENTLNLNLKPFCLNRNSHGLPFLGYLIYPDKTLLAHRSRYRFIQKIRCYNKNLENGYWTQKEYQQHIQPLIAFTEYARSTTFRKSILSISKRV